VIPSTRKRLSGFALACSALLVGLTGCAGTEGTPSGAPPATTTAPAASAKPSATPTADACPPDVNLMFEWLKSTKVIMDQLPSGVTGLEEPKCYQNWSMSRIVVKNADPALILFKLEPTTGKWIPVAAGTDNICDAQQVPADVQAKLGPGC
jgi:hypothetical protein